MAEINPLTGSQFNINPAAAKASGSLSGIAPNPIGNTLGAMFPAGTLPGSSGISTPNIGTADLSVLRQNPIYASTGPSLSVPTLRPSTAPTSPVRGTQVNYGGATSPGSVVDYLGSQGQASDFNSRASLAATNGITGYTGTAAQNAQLLGVLKTGSSSATQTGTGSTVLADGSGNVTSPTNFKVDTSGPVTSDAMNSSLSASDVMGSRKTYADYVNGLSQAQQYSPEYLQALQASQAAKGKESELNTNFYTGNNLPGDTLDYAQGSTARAVQLNSQKQLAANQALSVQELVRQGNIAGAKALVDANWHEVSPGTSVVDAHGQEVYSGLGGYQAVQGIQTVNNLAQNYADAHILPGDSLEVAQNKVANSPSFQARQTYLQQLAGGQTVAYNKLTGQYETVQGAGAASTISAASENLKKLSAQQTQLSTSLSTADKDFASIQDLMKRAKINDSQSPIINQLQNKFQAGVIGNGDVAAYTSAITELQSMYAGVLAAKNGGQVDDAVLANAKAIVPMNLNLANLQKVVAQVKTMGNNVLSSVNDSIKQQNSVLGGGSTGTSGNSSVGNSWANLH